MHELSIAQAIVEQVRLHAPIGVHVHHVCVRAGPMRGIEPNALQWAWQAATQNTALEQTELQLDELPWNLECPDCGNTFCSDDLYAPCQCGCDVTFPVGGDELTLMSLEIDQHMETEDTSIAQPVPR